MQYGLCIRYSKPFSEPLVSSQVLLSRGTTAKLKVFLRVQPKLPKLRVRNRTRDTIVADRADVAGDSSTRRTGLLKRSGLAPGEGLWIVPCEAVHTFGMKFDIDVLFLSKKRKDTGLVKVLKVAARMPKRRLAWSLMAHSVLELPAGMVETTRTVKGDELELERFDG